MLSLNSRPLFRTLLDAVFLKDPSPTETTLIYLNTEASPMLLTRQQFADEVRRYGAALQGSGVAPRDLVIIADTQSITSILAFWGAMVAGAIPSMFPTLTEKLDPDIYQRNLAELVRLSNVKAVLTTEEFAPTLTPLVDCKVFTSQSLLRALDKGRNTFLPYQPAPSEIAFLQHSSGTTGLQKGVALTHEAVLNQLASYSDAIDLNKADVIVSWLPLYHDMGLIAGFLLPLVQGIPLVIMSPFDWVAHPAMLLRAIHEYKCTLCWLPNFAYNHMARRIRQRDTEEISVKTIRAFINCSEPARYDSHKLFLARFAANGARSTMLAVSYAMAENTFAVTQTSIGQPPNVDTVVREALEQELVARPASESDVSVQHIVSCGQPITGVEVRIVDDRGGIAPERAVGEIHIRSNSLLKEYYKRRDLQALDAAGWYATGDRGYIADGELYIIGRSKDLIISAGKNLYPQDLEAIINTVPGVHPGRAVVFGVPDEKEGTELVAIIAEVATDDPDERQRIQQAVRNAVVSQAETSAHFVSLVNGGWLIKTSSGKIARGANRDKWQAERAEKARETP
jgi:fatty-acyl-CoA synthase